VEAAAQSGGVDAARLRRVVDIARALGDLKQRLTTGIHGLGRAAYGLAVAPGSISTWAGVFPNNPFQVPVAIDMSGDTPQLAAGLLEGQLREVSDGFALLRQARLELTKPQEAARNAGKAPPLRWSTLSPEEKRLCPPVVLLGNDDSLGGRGLAALIWLLGSDWPIKIVVLSDLDLGIGAGGMMGTPITSARNPKVNLGLLALAQRQAYVAQTSIAEPTHLHESIKDALDFPGPALLNIYAPSPERHGYSPAKTLEHAKQATAARVFPLFRYDPECTGVFGSRIDLQGNPDPDTAWLEAHPYTPADWARGQRRFATHFTPLTEDACAPTPLTEYLDLNAKDRLGKTPFVSASRNGEEPARYAVGPDLVAATQERLHGWRTLQELAGRVTPFTAQVELRAGEMVAQAHQSDLVQLKQEYEARIKDLEAEIAVRIQNRLMTLAGYGSVDSNQ
jgi:pyruvate-ferredoxin/flavodoxin oxidoreductase